MHLNRKGIKFLFETPPPLILPESYREDTGLSILQGHLLIMRSSQAKQTSGLKLLGG